MESHKEPLNRSHSTASIILLPGSRLHDSPALDKDPDTSLPRVLCSSSIGLGWCYHDIASAAMLFTFRHIHMSQVYGNHESVSDSNCLNDVRAHTHTHKLMQIPVNKFTHNLPILSGKQTEFPTHTHTHTHMHIWRNVLSLMHIYLLLNIYC